MICKSVLTSGILVIFLIHLDKVAARKLTKDFTYLEQDMASNPEEIKARTVFSEKQGVFISVSPEKGIFKVGEKMALRLHVKNNNKEPVYIIGNLNDPLYLNINEKGRETFLNNDLHIQVKDQQIYSEFVEIPTLQRLDPEMTLEIDVTYTLKDYTSGSEFSVYLSVYFLIHKDAVDLMALADLIGANKIGIDFQEAEMLVTAGPIKLSIG